MELKDILVKKPFVAIQPGFGAPELVRDDTETTVSESQRAMYVVVQQIDFIRQYNPSGHKINSEEYYPDKVKYDEKTQQYFKERVFRATFPFQRIILVQQLVHLCGNDIHIELTGASNSERERKLLLELRRGWLDCNMETAFYRLAKSVKKTGDGAVVFYMRNKQLRWKALGYDYGDTLFPHYNENGELEVFARRYCDYDKDMNTTTTFVEVWDDTYMYQYKRDDMSDGFIDKLTAVLGLGGFRRIDKVEHGFKEVPVVYHRDDDGACWSGSQDSIDKFELAVSHLCQNNMAYAFPIMLLKGDDIDIQADIYGAVKAITMGRDDDASYLMPGGSAELFRIQLDMLLKNIFQGSFAVMPPEVKSGDLPGVAIKLIYSPSIDKAMIDAKEYDPDIDKMLRLFAWGYGMQVSKQTQFSQLGLLAWIEPYVHQNQSELVNNICMLVNSGLLSRETGSKLTGLNENDEYDKIILEEKMAQQADLLNDIKLTEGVAQ